MEDVNTSTYTYYVMVSNERASVKYAERIKNHNQTKNVPNTGHKINTQYHIKKIFKKVQKNI